MNEDKDIQPKSQKSRRQIRKRKIDIETTRQYLAILIVILVSIVGITSYIDPTAGLIFDKVLPLLTLILGYYFGAQHT